MSKQRRIVITGMAPICAMGSNKEEFFENLYSGKMVLKEIDEEIRKQKKIKTRYVVPYPELESSKYTEKADRYRNRMSTSTYATCMASFMALEDANLEKAYDDMAVIMGMGTVNIENTYDAILSYHEQHKLEHLAIPIIMPNSVSSWISILHSCHGPSYSVNLACSSATAAIGQAYLGIKNGQYNAAFCGGTECFKGEEYIILKSFEYLHTVTGSKDGIPRVFSEERSGFLFNEGGSCVLILEELECALKRNARIYAEITSYSENNEASNIVAIDEQGEIMERTIREAIGNERIDYYNAHGTGTRQNDFVEAKVIERIFRDEHPYINSTKGYLGHSIGASGAFEACVCADSIYNNRVHGNQLGTPIAELNFTQEPVYTEIKTGVSASFGFGGHDTVLVMKKYVE